MNNPSALTAWQRVDHCLSLSNCFCLCDHIETKCLTTSVQVWRVTDTLKRVQYRKHISDGNLRIPFHYKNSSYQASRSVNSSARVNVTNIRPLEGLTIMCSQHTYLYQDIYPCFRPTSAPRPLWTLAA